MLRQQQKTNTLKLDVCIAQHQGDRKEQQDRIAIVSHRRAPGVCMAVVADGMGGHTGGAQAAAQVIHSTSLAFQEWGIRNDARQLIDDCLQEAHSVIKASRFIDEKDPRSTAVVLILLPDGSCMWAHCGDSRLYCFRGERLLFRTADHSYVEHLVRTGKITPEMVETHPKRNILLTSLGGAEDPQIDYGSMKENLQTRPLLGDSFLLCSDGLWGYFKDAELGQIISSLSAREASAKLIEIARERGEGYGDNISLALLKFIEDPTQKTPPLVAAPHLVRKKEIPAQWRTQSEDEDLDEDEDSDEDED
jgi:serine/threonine protein phosphatase PrpC